MLSNMMIVAIIVGTGALGVLPSKAGFFAPSLTEHSLESIEISMATRGIASADEHSLQFPRYLVRRKSSKPPSESHTSRASSSPAGEVAESGRDSGRPLDLSERPSYPGIDNPSHQGPEETMVTPQKSGDPFEGKRKSQPATRKRGGVVK